MNEADEEDRFKHWVISHFGKIPEEKISLLSLYIYIYLSSWVNRDKIEIPFLREL